MILFYYVIESVDVVLAQDIALGPLKPRLNQLIQTRIIYQIAPIKV